MENSLPIVCYAKQNRQFDVDGYKALEQENETFCYCKKDRKTMNKKKRISQSLLTWLCKLAYEKKGSIPLSGKPSYRLLYKSQSNKMEYLYGKKGNTLLSCPRNTFIVFPCEKNNSKTILIQESL